MSIQQTLPRFVYDPIPKKFNLYSWLSSESASLSGYAQLNQGQYQEAVQTYVSLLKNREVFAQHNSQTFLLKNCLIRAWNGLTTGMDTGEPTIDLNKINAKVCEILGFCRDRRVKLDCHKIHKSLTSKIHMDDRFYLDIINYGLGYKEYDMPVCRISYYPESIGPWEYCRAETAGLNLEKTMEDVTAAQATEWPALDDTNIPVYMFGVFDGHISSASALWLRDHLHTYVIQEIKEFTNLVKRDQGIAEILSKTDSLSTQDWVIWHALKFAFVRAAEDWKKDPLYDDSGTTATVLFLAGDWAWVANVGDSRTVLAGPKKAQVLSLDAKFDNGDFENSVLKRGGFIRTVSTMSRLDGKLAMARSFGDFECKGITTRPKIKKICWNKHKKSAQRYFVLASDGLWDVLETTEIPKIIKGCPLLHPQDLTRHLIQKALKRKSMDNISVIAVEIPSQDKEAETPVSFIPQKTTDKSIPKHLGSSASAHNHFLSGQNKQSQDNGKP